MTKLPNRYAAAAAALRTAVDGRLAGQRDIFIRQERGADNPITILAGDAAVTFYADGRVKISTHGSNHELKLRTINQFLPRGYFCRRMQRHDPGRVKQSMTPQVYLLGPGRGFDNPIASFLASTTFLPEQPASDCRRATDIACERRASA